MKKGILTLFVVLSLVGISFYFFCPSVFAATGCPGDCSGTSPSVQRGSSYHHCTDTPFPPCAAVDWCGDQYLDPGSLSCGLPGTQWCVMSDLCFNVNNYSVDIATTCDTTGGGCTTITAGTCYIADWTCPLGDECYEDSGP